MKDVILLHYQRVKALYERYERYLMPATLIAGVIVDYFTFSNIQIRTVLAILALHFLVAGATIAFTNFYDSQKISSRFRYARLFAPLLLQFSFGALLSASFIFYWFSGAFSASWPLILVISLLMLSNEVLRHLFLRPSVQISVYFFVTFSVLSLALPLIFTSLSPWLFVAAGLVSLAVIVAYTKFLAKYLEAIKYQQYGILGSVTIIFAFMIFLYFQNVIPPIPLSLREAGVYHNILHSGGTYYIEAEKESLWAKLVPGQTIHWRLGDKVFVYTSIFAPGNLGTTVLHHWEHYEDGKWVSKDKLPFRISGGRKEGFRGYSLKSAVSSGYWRVGVETERGQVLGRIRFGIKQVEQRPELEVISR